MKRFTYVLSFGVGLALVTAAHADVTVKTNGPDVSVTQNGGVAIQQAAPASTPTVVAAPAGQNLIPLGQWSSLDGHVTQVDQQARTMTMTLNGTNTVVLIPEDPSHTVYYKEGNHQTTLNDIHVGDNVTVRRI
jgi:hypothetical protein